MSCAAIFLSALTALAASGAKNLGELRTQLQETLAESASPGALWGIQVNSRRTGATWFATNAAARLIPASNTKLFTAALTLDRLGADYRFVTSVRTSAPPNADGILLGDLLVVGGGDPTRCGRLYGDRWENAFAPLVEAIHGAGIRRIAGHLLCDESRFRGAPYGSGWAWDDLAYGYGAAVSALSAEDNEVRLVAEPGPREGDPVKLWFEPLSPGLTLRANVFTSPTNVPRRLSLTRLPGTSELDVTGSVPVGSARLIEEASVPTPALWFGTLLREALRRAGIEVAGEIRRITDRDRAQAPLYDAQWRELAAIPSPPAGEVVREMMKPSQNLYAQMLLLSVGAEVELYPRDDEVGGSATTSTEESGLKAMDRFLRPIGIPKEDVQIEEGSGLSRKNLLTPRATIQLLEFMTRHRWAAEWEASLPVGGVDGTLRNRFKQGPALGNVRAKTGNLQNVSSLSGYLTNAVGEPLVFSIMVNSYVASPPAASARQEIDRLVELLARSEFREP